MERSVRAVAGGPEGEARIRRLQDATEYYAVWHVPMWHSAVAGAMLLCSALLIQVQARRAGMLLTLYTPLVWAAAGRFGLRRWAPALGQVQSTRGPAGIVVGLERIFLTLALVQLNLTAPLLGEFGMHAAAASLGGLAFLWAGKAPLVGGSVVALAAYIGVDFAHRPGDWRGMAGRLVAGAALLAMAALAPLVRRRSVALLARAAAEMRASE